MNKIAAFLIIFLIPVQQVLAKELFKWVDDHGQTHFSDIQPPPDAKKQEKKNVIVNQVDNNSLPYETSVAANKYPVVLYIFDGCGKSCDIATTYLKNRKIPYTVKNTKQDMDDLKKKTGVDVLPVMIVGNQPPLKGFNQNDWGSLLDLAGYPKAEKSAINIDTKKLDTKTP